MERRRHFRVVRSMDARWSGASGIGACRIADIGIGGCFVQTVAIPLAGEPTSVTLVIEGAEVTFKGRIKYVEPTIGFAMQFDEMPGPAHEALQRFVNQLTAEQGKP